MYSRGEFIFNSLRFMLRSELSFEKAFQTTFDSFGQNLLCQVILYYITLHCIILYHIILHSWMTKKLCSVSVAAVEEL